MDAMLEVPGSNLAEVRVTAETVEGKASLKYIERAAQPAPPASPAAGADDEDEDDEGELMARSA